MMRSLLCLLALLPLVLGNLSSRYAFSSTLYNRNGDTYVLHWNFSTAERTIAFAVNVSTTGWVGFGLSPNGGMVNSDVVMGWVRSGQAYFHVSLLLKIKIKKLQTPRAKLNVNLVDHIIICMLIQNPCEICCQ